MTELDILKEFLLYPLNSVDEIMKRFETLPNAEKKSGNGKQQFVFVRGNRKDAATLVAHADTYPSRDFDYAKHEISEKNGIIRSASPDYGLGADDRAGCAILWLLKDSGHNLLITDGEECGRIGAEWLMSSKRDIAEIIHKSSFMIQFDRKNGRDYKYYNIRVSEEFIKYIEKETGYSEPDKDSSTDIVTLCNDKNSCCGVNLSVGYYNEHTVNESLNIEEWSNTLKIAKLMLNKPLERFPLKTC